ASFLAALPPVFINGYLFWLLQPAGPGEEPIQCILSFSMAAEQFGWVYVPPWLSSRMCHLSNLDGLLYTVFDGSIRSPAVVAQIDTRAVRRWRPPWGAK
ncbi:hypothetical protein E2562_037553, partial [Oryza meyeriana var. granulata]